MHDQRIRDIEAFIQEVRFVPPDSALAVNIAAAFTAWKQQRLEKGPHPLGSPKLMHAGALVDTLLKADVTAFAAGDPSFKSGFEQFAQVAKKLATVPELAAHVGYC